MSDLAHSSQIRPARWGTAEDVRNAVCDYYHNKLGTKAPVLYIPLWEGSGNICSNVGTYSPCFGSVGGDGIFTREGVTLAGNTGNIGFGTLPMWQDITNATLIIDFTPKTLEDWAGIGTKFQESAYCFGFMTAGGASYGGQNDVLFLLRSGASTQFANTTSDILVANQRIVLAGVYNGYGATDAEKAKVYKNGVEQSLSFAGIQPTSLAAHFGTFSLGRNVGETVYYNAAFLGCKLFDCSLSESSINLDYNNPYAAIQPRAIPKYFFPSASVLQTIGITATTEAVTVSGINASISVGATVTASTGAVTVSGVNADITNALTVFAETAAVTISGINAGVSIGVTFSASTEALTVSGINAGVTNPLTITATTGAVVITEINASVSVGVTITATTGAVALSGISASVYVGVTVTSTAGAVMVSDSTADVSVGVVIDAETGVVIIASINPSITAFSGAIECTTEIITISGIRFSVILTPSERIYIVGADARTLNVAEEDRVFKVPYDDRTAIIIA